MTLPNLVASCWRLLLVLEEAPPPFVKTMFTHQLTFQPITSWSLQALLEQARVLPQEPQELVPQAVWRLLWLLAWVLLSFRTQPP